MSQWDLIRVLILLMMMTSSTATCDVRMREFGRYIGVVGRNESVIVKGLECNEYNSDYIAE